MISIWLALRADKMARMNKKMFVWVFFSPKLVLTEMKINNNGYFKRKILW